MNCLTISYKTAPVAVRAQFSFNQEEIKQLVGCLMEEKLVKECVILSTCNRSEIYYTGDNKAVTKISEKVAAMKHISHEEFLKHLHVFSGEKALRHLYKVTCGMDSMVLGEDEILGQVKDAFFFAREQKMTGYHINMVFQDAITCAKRVKTDTNLSKIPVSIATLVANEVFRLEKEDKKVLIIGISGKMGQIVMKNINSRPGIHIKGTLRHHNMAIQVLEPGVEAVEYDKRYEAMDDADVIISVTSSPHYTIIKEELAKALHTKRDRLFLDLSVPLDIDAQISELEGVTLYDLDYFEQVSKENNEVKYKELGRAEEMIDVYVEEVKKTLLFHDFLKDIPKVKAVFKERSFESMMYALRDESSSEELAVITEVLRRL